MAELESLLDEYLDFKDNEQDKLGDTAELIRKKADENVILITISKKITILMDMLVSCITILQILKICKYVWGCIF